MDRLPNEFEKRQLYLHLLRDLRVKYLAYAKFPQHPELLHPEYAIVQFCLKLLLKPAVEDL